MTLPLFVVYVLLALACAVARAFQSGLWAAAWAHVGVAVFAGTALALVDGGIAAALVALGGAGLHYAMLVGAIGAETSTDHGKDGTQDAHPDALTDATAPDWLRLGGALLGGTVACGIAVITFGLLPPMGAEEATPGSLAGAAFLVVLIVMLVVAVTVGLRASEKSSRAGDLPTA